jgi:hypothetical protein
MRLKAMTRNADSVSESVKSGALGLRTLVIEAGKAGAEATAQAVEIAERKLSEGTDEFAKTSLRTRKNFEKRTKGPRKELKTSAAATRKETLLRAAELRKPGRRAKQAAILAAKSAGDSRRRGKNNFKAAKADFRTALVEAKSAVKGERTQRRRWPWLLGIAAVVAGAVYARRSSRQEPPVEAMPPTPAELKPTAATQPAAAPGSALPEAVGTPLPDHNNGRQKSSVPGDTHKN